MLSLIIVILALAGFIVGPTILYCSARIVRVKELTFSRAYGVFFLLFSIRIVWVAFILLIFPASRELNIMLCVSYIFVAALLLRWRLRTTDLRAVGCFILDTVLIVGLAFGIRTVAVDAFLVPTGSMSPTILPGDRFLADKITGHFRGFHKGEIVAFFPPSDPTMTHVKRIVAVAGDRIEVRRGLVYVNGAASGLCPSMPYRIAGMTPLQFPCTVPPGKLFLLGDNRDYSVDSRHYGFVDAQAVVGLAVIVYASVEQPLDPHETILLRREGKDPDQEARPNRIRWERIGTILR
jgi:signal peptidase I